MDIATIRSAPTGRTNSSSLAFWLPPTSSLNLEVPEEVRAAGLAYLKDRELRLKHRERLVKAAADEKPYGAPHHEGFVTSKLSVPPLPGCLIRARWFVGFTFYLDDVRVQPTGTFRLRAATLATGPRATGARVPRLAYVYIHVRAVHHSEVV